MATAVAEDLHHDNTTTVAHSVASDRHSVDKTPALPSNEKRGLHGETPASDVAQDEQSGDYPTGIRFYLIMASVLSFVFLVGLDQVSRRQHVFSKLSRY